MKIVKRIFRILLSNNVVFSFPIKKYLFLFPSFNARKE